jgi:hypothetical protein
MAVRAIGKVVDAYALDKRTQRKFRTDGAFPHDARILSWDLESETVSLWTVPGRRRMPFECGGGQRTFLVPLAVLNHLLDAARRELPGSFARH